MFRIENLTFKYPTRERVALNNVSLSIKKGEFITVFGASGCGKTTLLRLLKPTISPQGTKGGKIFFEDRELNKLNPRDVASKIGFVFQSPDNQIVTDKVWHELAFGLESLGKKTPEICLRIAEMASFFGIQSWFHKPVAELSGGQKQVLVLASVLVMQPSVLILDEPTSQLDPIAASEFISILAKINRELGVTIIITEHRLEEVLPISTRAIVMQNGEIMADDTPANIGLNLHNQDSGLFLAMPVPMRICLAANMYETKIPITVSEGVEWLSGQPIKTNSDEKNETNSHALDIAIELEDIWFKYEKKLPDVLKGLSFKANYGQITAVLGGNGTGKTTLLSLIAKLYKPYRGKINTKNQVYALPQNPQSLFIAKTVGEELLEMQAENKNIDKITKLCRLEDLLSYHPYDLSGGEQQRVALAKVLLLQPKILLLDEPTKGLDAEYKQIFADILHNLTNAGVAVILVSHDIEFCAEYADRCALFFDGTIITEGRTKEFFCGNSFYTTSANRMSRHILAQAVTVADVVDAIAVTTESRRKKVEKPVVFSSFSTTEEPMLNLINSPVNHLSKRTMLAALMILLTIPITIFLGIYLFDDRRFYFISMLIILQTMLPFMLVYESRKPQVKEIIIIAVLCAIAVAGRSAFFMLPQFKPVIAMVIIAGVAFGGEAGFLVGATTGFVSNMFFGQGPWTPWQMFAFGLIGFIAGILFGKGLLSRSTPVLAIFGGFATIIIYGGIMNPAGVIMWQPNPTIEMFIIAYLQGIPFDLIHAAATVIFLIVTAKPMLDKLDRIKLKYGL